jgi:hypothetical protein
LPIDHPADRHGLAALRLEPHFAIGSHGRRHVEHDGRLLHGRHGDRHRIGAEKTFAAAPWRQVVVAAHREIHADHVVSERHRHVKRRRPCVVAHARAHPADSCRFRLFDRQFGGATHHQMTHAVVAIDQRDRRPFADHANVRFGIDAAGT